MSFQTIKAKIPDDLIKENEDLSLLVNIVNQFDLNITSSTVPNPSGLYLFPMSIYKNPPNPSNKIDRMMALFGIRELVDTMEEAMIKAKIGNRKLFVVDWTVHLSNICTTYHESLYVNLISDKMRTPWHCIPLQHLISTMGNPYMVVANG